MNKAIMRRLSSVCLMLTILIFLLFQINKESYALATYYYLCPIVFFFLGITVFTDRFRKQIDLWIGLLLMAWFIVSHVLMGEFYLQTSYQKFGILLAAMCLALPFSSCADNERQSGFQCASVWIAVTIGITAWLSIGGIIIGEPIRVPLIGSVFGKDASEDRLFANITTNQSAALFLVAMVFAIWYLLEHGRRWMRVPGFALVMGLYVGIALTVSRTVMIQVCLAAALMVFFTKIKKPVKQNKKQFAIVVLFAALSFAGIYVGYEFVRKLINAFVVAVASAESIQSRPIADHLFTLNGRAQIYADVLNLLWSNPKVVLLGATTAELGELTSTYLHGFNHAHNAYLQVWVEMGLPGLFGALWFSFRTIQLGWRLLISYGDKVSAGQRWMAIALMVMLLSAVPEPYLFAGNLPSYNFFFFLIFGYLINLEYSIRSAQLSR